MNPRRQTTPTPLRIAMVAACPFPSMRGSQVLIRELAQGLADRGHEVHLVTYPEGESMAAVRGIRVHRARRVRGAARREHWGWRRVLLDISLARTLYRIVREARIQVIHAHNYEAPVASFLVRWLTGVPVVYHSHNALSDELAYYCAPGWRRRVAGVVGRMLDRQVPRRADFSIALTDDLESFLRSCGATAVAKVPPGSGLALAATASDEGGRFAGKFVVMYTGNLDPYQDLEVLWSAFRTLLATVPESLLVVVTHEAQWSTRAGSALTELVDAGSAQVIVAPTFAVVRRAMASADVLVSPRQSWSGYPIKLLNYLAAGRAVVAAAGSAKGIVDGRNGLVFANGDAAGLAAALDRLAQNVPLRVRLGEQAQAAIRAAVPGRRDIDQIEAIYAHVVGRAAGGRSMLRPAEETGARGLMTFPKDRISAASGE